MSRRFVVGCINDGVRAVLINKITAPYKVTKVNFLVRVMNNMWICTNGLRFEPIFVFAWPLKVFMVNIVAPVETGPDVAAEADGANVTCILFPRGVIRGVR